MTGIEMNKQSYNKIARKWADVRNTSFVSKLVVAFAEKITSGGSILDVGCGTGQPLASYLCNKGFEVTGVDASERMIEMAQSANLPNAEFITSDFFDYQPTKQFDGVLAWDSFFHFPREKQPLIYPMVSDLLKPGGYLLFTCGDADGEHVDHMMGEPFYYSALPKDTIRQLLAGNGFTLEYAHENFVEKRTQRDLVILAKKLRR